MKMGCKTSANAFLLMMHACTLFMVEKDGKKDERTIAQLHFMRCLSFYDVFYTFEEKEGFCCYGCHSMQY
jgi:hypothetical protein